MGLLVLKTRDILGTNKKACQIPYRITSPLKTLSLGGKPTLKLDRKIILYVKTF